MLGNAGSAWSAMCPAKIWRGDVTKEGRVIEIDGGWWQDGAWLLQVNSLASLGSCSGKSCCSPAIAVRIL